MATLKIRQLKPWELIAIQRVRARRERLDLPLEQADGPGLLSGSVISTLPGGFGDPQVYVSIIEDEICGYLLIQRDDRNYRWNLVSVGAGSSRLEASDEACIELWSALSEHVTTRAGQAGARRLFASAVDGTPAHRSLCDVGFMAYGRVAVMRGRLQSVQHDPPSGLREQHASDVWSIHQLYHRSTPRPVQFAQALTSEEWNLPRRRDRLPLVGIGFREYSFVVESTDGVCAFARVTRRRGAAFVSFLLQTDRGLPVEPFFAAVLERSGVGAGDEVCICVPGFLSECIAPLEQLGLTVRDERELLVKHTTAAAIVHPKLVPLPATRLKERRAARRAPSLMRGQVAIVQVQRQRSNGITESEYTPA